MWSLASSFCSSTKSVCLTIVYTLDIISKIEMENPDQPNY